MFGRFRIRSRSCHGLGETGVSVGAGRGPWLEELEGRLLLSSIEGQVFNDLDGDGVLDGGEGEAGLAGWRVFLDENGNGVLDGDEVWEETDGDGSYLFEGLVEGEYVVGVETHELWRQTSPFDGMDLEFTLMPPEGGELSFGSRVAFTDDYVLVANWRSFGESAFEVHQYDRSTGSYIRRLEDLPSFDSNVGFDIAAGGDFLFVGSGGVDTGVQDSGGVFVFDLNDGRYIETIVNPSPNMNDYFGYQVEVLGGQLFVSALWEEVGGISRAGAVYIFDVSTRDQAGMIVSPNPRSESFGISLGGHGGNLIVGSIARHPDFGSTGYLYDVETGSHLRSYEVVSSGTPENGRYEWIGDGDRLYAVSSRDRTLLTDSGAIHVFDGASGAMLESWYDPDPVERGYFGDQFALLNGVMVVTSPRRSPGTNDARVYYLDGRSGALLDTLKNLPGDERDGFGSFIVSDDDQVAVSSPGRDNGSLPSGAVDVYAAPKLVHEVSLGMDGSSVGHDFGYQFIDDRWEENDSLETAHDVSDLRDQWFGRTGSQVRQFDEDWYRVDLELIPSHLRVAFDQDETVVDIDLEVYDGEGNLFYEADVVGGHNSVELEAEGHKTFYFRVFGSDLGREYDMRWSARERGVIQGMVYEDLDGDGFFEPDLGEFARPGWTVFLDANRNGQLDGGERFVMTDEFGAYEFRELVEGNYRVNHVLEAHYLDSATEDGAVPNVTVMVYDARREIVDWGVQALDDRYEENDVIGEAWAAGLLEGELLSSVMGRGRQYDDDWYAFDVEGSGRVFIEIQRLDQASMLEGELYDSSGALLGSFDAFGRGHFRVQDVVGGERYFVRVFGDNSGDRYDVIRRKVDEGGVDLEGAGIWIDDFEVGWGETVEVSWAVRNAGDAGVVNDFDMVFYLSEDDEIGVGDLELGRREVMGIGGGEYYAETWGFALPNAGALPTAWPDAGPFFVLMDVDGGDAIGELDEADNRHVGYRVDTTTIQVGAYLFPSASSEVGHIFVTEESKRDPLSFEVVYESVHGIDVHTPVGQSVTVSATRRTYEYSADLIGVVSSEFGSELRARYQLKPPPPDGTWWDLFASTLHLSVSGEHVRDLHGRAVPGRLIDRVVVTSGEATSGVVAVYPDDINRNSGDRYSVALHEGRLYMAASTFNPVSNEGELVVYVFGMDEGVWIQEERILVADHSSSGSDVWFAIDGDYFVVSHERNQESYLYRHDGVRWVANGVFAGGGPVDIDGDRFVSSGLQSLVFRRSGLNWAVEGFLPSGDSVGIFDTHIVIGQWDVDEFSVDSGRVLSYRYEGGSWGDQRSLNFSGQTRDARFGTSVDFADGLLTVGAARPSTHNDPVFYRYFFLRGEWREVDAIVNPVGPFLRGLGREMSTTQDRIVMSGTVDRNNVAYVLEKIGGDWEIVTTITGARDSEDIRAPVAIEGTFFALGDYEDFGRILAAPVIAEDGYEENDEFGDAYDVSVFGVGSLGEISGFGVLHDDDWYVTRTVDPNVVVEFVVEGVSGDEASAFEIYDEGGVLMGQSREVDGEQRGHLLMEEEGVVYVRVMRGETSSRYDLSWTMYETSGESDILISPVSGLMTTEEGGRDEVSISLGAKPTDNVTLAMLSGDDSQVSLSTNLLTFTPEDWFRPQVVEFVGGDADFVDEEDVSVVVTIFPAASNDPSYSGKDPEDLVVLNRDNDTAGVVAFGETFLITTEHDLAAPGTVPSSAMLVDSGSEVKVWVPAGPGTETGWQGEDEDFVDDHWISGVTGIGYDTNPHYLPFINLDLSEEMQDVNTTAYVRVPFTVSNIGQIRSLVLRMRFDDGFAAYLNGVPMHSWNSPAWAELDWDSSATTQSPDPEAVVFREFDITSYLSDLREGENVLAIHGLNFLASSSDFLIDTQLEAFFHEGPARVGVRLNSEPTDEVRIELGVSDLTEGTFGEFDGELLFTPANWNVVQHVEVFGVNDDESDGNQVYELLFDSIVSDDEKYHGLGRSSLELVNLDDEDFEAGEFRGVVYEDVNGNGERDGSEEGLAGWTIYVDVDGSGVFDSGEPFAVTGEFGRYELKAPSSGTFEIREIRQAGWALRDPESGVYRVNITFGQVADGIDFGNENLDDGYEENDRFEEAFDLTVFEGLKLSEVGGVGKLFDEDWYRIDLGGDQSRVLIEAFFEHGMGDVNLHLFDEAGELVRDAISVTDDEVLLANVEAGGSYHLRVSGVDAGQDYDLMWRGFDGMSPGGLVVETDGLLTDESGGSAGISVRLDVPPTGLVQVLIESSDEGEGVAGVSELVFHLGNWETGQLLTVSGVDDLVEDGDVGYEVSFSGAVGSDPVWSEVDLGSVPLVNMDDDPIGIAGVVFEDRNEDGMLDGGDRGLGGERVYLDIDGDGMEDAGEPFVLTDEDGAFMFVGLEVGSYVVRHVPQVGWGATGPANSRIVVSTGAQSVVGGVEFGVSYVDDAYEENDELAASFDLRGHERRYLSQVNGVGYGYDEDWYRISVEADDWLFVDLFFDGGSDDMDLWLYDAGGELKARFESAGDYEHGEIQLAVGGDYYLRVVNSGAGASYDLLWYSFGEDANAGVYVSPTEGLVTTESGGEARFDVALDTPPTDTVFMLLSSSDVGEGTLSTTALQFTPGNWYVPQTVIVTGKDDAEFDGDVGYEVVTQPTVSNDGAYLQLDGADVSVTNLDNEGKNDIDVIPVARMEGMGVDYLADAPGSDVEGVFTVREVGDFYVELWALADALAISGTMTLASLELGFDADVVSPLAIEYGDHFDEVLLSDIDLVGGLVDFAVGQGVAQEAEEDYVLIARVLFGAHAAIDATGEAFGPFEAGLSIREGSMGFELGGEAADEVRIGETPEVWSRGVIFDVDNNDVVNFADFGLFLGSMGEVVGGGGGPYVTWADFDADGVVDEGDRDLILDALGKAFELIEIPEGARTEGGGGVVDLLAEVGGGMPV